MSDDWQVVMEALHYPHHKNEGLAALGRLREREAQLERDCEMIESWKRREHTLESDLAQVTVWQKNAEAQRDAFKARMYQNATLLDEQYARAEAAEGQADEQGEMAEKAEARVARLEEALREILALKPSEYTASVMATIARRALAHEEEPKATNPKFSGDPEYKGGLMDEIVAHEEEA